MRGDPNVGVVATVEHEGRGFIRFLAVDPDHRGQGHGHELVRAAEADAAGLGSLQTGADPPYYLWPGVPATETALLCLLERHKYARVEPTSTWPSTCATSPTIPVAMRCRAPRLATRSRRGWTPTTPTGRPKCSVRSTTARCSSRDHDGILGFCAYDVTRGGLVGPVGARLDLIGKGIGRPLLIGALHRMRADGRERVEVSWVGPIVPYARVGGSVSRVFFVFRKELKQR